MITTVKLKTKKNYDLISEPLSSREHVPPSDEELKMRRDHALNNTHAYDDVRALEGKKQSWKGKRQTVLNMMKRWRHMERDLKINVVPHHWREFFHLTRWAASENPYHQDAITQDQSDFTVIPSSENRYRVEDKRGNLLLYRLRIPEPMTKQLNKTEHLIPMGGKHLHKQGGTINRQWALWAGSEHPNELQMSAQYLLDNKEGKADQWLEENGALFDYLSKVVVRNLNPQMYSKLMGVRTLSDEGLKPLCDAWAGCTINQDQIEDGTPYMDWKNYPFGVNVEAAWGPFTTSKLVLWQLRLSVELKPGDAVLFLGRLFSHNWGDIDDKRSSVDCFTHQDVIRLYEERLSRLRKRARDPRKRVREWSKEMKEDLNGSTGEGDCGEEEHSEDDMESSEVDYEELYGASR